MPFKAKISVFLLLLTLSCTFKFSPHAQNELINPYVPAKDKTNEFGAGFGFNEWTVRRESDSIIYIPLYPQQSLSFYFKGHRKDKIFRGFGGLEGIIPIQWVGIEVNSWTTLWLKLNFGGQFEFPYTTIRVNIIPFDIYAGYWDRKFNIESNFNRTSFYQFTLLLHNSQKFNPYFWLGIRNSSSAIGPLAGIEISDKTKLFLRLEYSYLNPTPYSLILNKDELKDIQGSVHYLTLGVFKKLK
jgi:hypothetical protein